MAAEFELKNEIELLNLPGEFELEKACVSEINGFVLAVKDLNSTETTGFLIETTNGKIARKSKVPIQQVGRFYLDRNNKLYGLQRGIGQLILAEPDRRFWKRLAIVRNPSVDYYTGLSLFFDPENVPIVTWTEGHDNPSPFFEFDRD